MTKPISSQPNVCKRIFLLSICIFFMTNIFAQVGISTTSITPDATSILELRSTTLGFLAPRMTTTQRDAITSPATGLLIYSTTTNQLNYYSGAAWQVVTGGGQSQLNGTGFVKASGTTISYDNSTYITSAVTSFSKTDNYGITSSVTNPTTTPTHTIGVDTTLISSRLWRQKGIDSLSAIIVTKGTGTVTSFSKTDNYGITSSVTNSTSTPNHTIGIDTTLISSRLWRQKGIDSLGAIIATKGTGTVTSVTSATPDATVATTTTTPVITIVSAPKLTTARTIQGVSFDGTANINPVNGTGFVKASGTTISYDNSTYITSAVTSFSKTDNYGITSSVANSTTTPNYTVGVDTTLISSRLWRQKGIDSLGAIIATKGTGTVTSASIVSANGFAGTVATATTTPAITISTSVNGIAKGNGTALSAATSGTDYSAGTSGLATGILKSTTGTGALSVAIASDFPTLNQNTTGNAATVTTNANLTGDVTSVGNATTIGASKVTNAMLAGSIDLTTKVTGVLPIANGGTNSSTTLNNNRIMVSSSSVITEAAALTNGQILIGSTSAAPVAANLTAGNGIIITNTAGAITIANNPTISQATATADVTTTSTTDVLLTGMTITPGAGDYLVFFTGSMENNTSNQQGPVSIYSNGVQIAASVVRSINTLNKSNSVATNAYITGLGAGQAIDIRWNVLSGTGTFHQRTLIVQRVK